MSPLCPCLHSELTLIPLLSREVKHDFLRKQRHSQALTTPHSPSQIRSPLPARSACHISWNLPVVI